jgi:hypothetical protein
VRDDFLGESEKADDVFKQATEEGVVELLGGGSFSEGFAHCRVGEDGGDEELEV